MMAGVTLSELSGLCNRQRVSIYLNVKATGTIFGSAGTYELADIIICTQVLNITAGSEINEVVLGTADCENQNTADEADARANFALGDMSARDMKDGAGAIAIQISG
jgi:hypothetical protein